MKSKIILLVLCAICSYLIGGINPSIVLSNAIYHQDIRELGSKNPGFTNFKRVFGGKYAWFVFVMDLLKSALLCLIFGLAFRRIFDSFQLGAAYTGFCAMLGHSFPVWYHFQGGKGFLVAASAIWFIDWRAGLIALIVMMALLFTVKYMSLSVLCAAVTCPITLAIVGVKTPSILVFVILSVLLMIYRHKENIIKLKNGTESKFHLKS